ncbi:DUF3667 domain-containing protein [Deminuibacter soli]|uniref:DUF3667 domain-containing protein n=1 Tax=Deminuibacter soli TaxID=2291815 RepID=UPI001314441D|nr:DUF3667 domain-containing protein [Deminuibacter soli]
MNCNAEVYGRYCHVCGQENIEPKDKFWHLVTHFAYDIIHFDGKFFTTAKFLLFRPGYLSTEYMRGRRADFLHPIRMYVFVSAFFFLTFLTFFKGGEKEKENEHNAKNVGVHINKDDTTAAGAIVALQEKREALVTARQTSAATPGVPGKVLRKLDNKIADTDSEIVRVQRDSTYKHKIQADNGDDPTFKTVAEYEADQAKKKPEDRDGWLERKFIERGIGLQKTYITNGDMNEHMKEKFWHSMPQLLFITLPFVALLLQLLYLRERRQYYYVNHVIFTVHLYCAIFIQLFIVFLLGSFKETSWLHWLVYLQIGVWLYMIYYLYKAIRNFYQQGAGKTIAKMVLLGFANLFMMSFLFVIFAIIFFFVIL